MDAENQVVCATCGRGFRSRRALGGHVKVHKNRNVRKDIVFPQNRVRRNPQRQCRRLRPPVYNEDEAWAIIFNSDERSDKNAMAIVCYQGGHDPPQPAAHGDQPKVLLLEAPPAGHGNEDAERLPTVTHGDQPQVLLLEGPPVGHGKEDAEREPTAESSSRRVVFDFDLNLPYLGEEEDED